MESCVFCSIVAGNIPAVCIDRNDSMIVIADRCPKAPIHWLVIPHTHIADIRAIATRADESIFTALLTTARDVIARYADNRPFKFLINNGFEAGQRVFHLHAHILVGPLENSDIAAL